MTETDSRDVAEGAGRVGLATRGVIYVVVGVLAAQVATGKRAEQTDQRGALAELADKPFGGALLVLLAAGFGAYALWRTVRAFQGEDGDDPAPHQRTADLGRAVIYLGLLASTAAILRGTGGTTDPAHTWTAELMTREWGRWLVGAIGTAMLAGGVWLIRRGLTERFREHLDRLSPGVVRLGRIGHVARGLAFMAVGAFLVRAAVRFDPNEPIGLDAALRQLASSEWGRLLVLGVGAGLAAFGLFSIAESRDRRVLQG